MPYILDQQKCWWCTALIVRLLILVILIFGTLDTAKSANVTMTDRFDIDFLYLIQTEPDTTSQGSTQLNFHLSRNYVESNLLIGLLNWIGAHSDYDISQALMNPPTTSFCKCGEIVEYHNADLMVEASFLALYDEQNRHIYLVEPWDPADLLNMSSLLHELAHSVQLDNKPWTCWGTAEREAYRLQEMWLEEHGAISGFNWIEIFFQTRCRQDIHP